MVLKLKYFFDKPGEKQNFNFDISLPELEGYKNITFVSPVAISGTLENRTGIVSVSFCVQACLKHVCDRCLDEFERRYSFDFRHMLVRSLSGENDDYIVCENDELDISELAVSDLLLQLPSKILCRDDCKGLCYICGKNLNFSDCSCREKQP
ncbi:MAG: DUF177 domain-containing protein [Oscillospiraceae bacterium]|jgi:uncharacterized protein